MTKILITGGAGFIGSNLCEYFVAQGYIVSCLDNLETGFKSNIEHLLPSKNFTFIEGDIRDLETCKSAVKGCTYVLHQAALGSVPRSIDDPIRTNSVNIDGFLNMLVASKDEKIKRFIYAASSSTYGDSTELPKVEHRIGNPLSPYAITKYVNELYANVFHKTYDIDTIGLRYFNVFGKRQNPNGQYAAVIPKFVDTLVNNEKLTINGDGTNSRDFTYIKNVIAMNELAMKSEAKNTLNQIYNTAYGKQHSLEELVGLIKSILKSKGIDSKSVIEYGPTRIGDIPHSLASIEKAKEKLFYQPLYNLESGMKEYIDWYLDTNNKT